MWTVILTSDAQRQYDKHASRSTLKATVDKILERLATEPLAPGNKLKALTGPLSGLYSRRIDSVNRVVYSVDHGIVTVRVISVWGHYGDT